MVLPRGAGDEPTQYPRPVEQVARGQDDDVEHTVVSSDGTFTSNNLGKDATFEQKFDTAGQFTYVCGIHPQMNGTITVSG